MRRLAISTFALRGRHGAFCTGLGRHVAAALCVAGVALSSVALGDIQLRFAWQALLYGTGLTLVVCLGAVSRPCRRSTLRGSCGAWRHPAPSFCFAGVALGDFNAGFSWQEHDVLATVERPALLFTASLGRPLFPHTSLAHVSLAHATLLHRPFVRTSAHTHTHRHKTLPHTTCHTPSFTHRHSQLGHAHSFTRNLNFVAHTFFPKLERTQLFTYNFLKDRSSTTSFVFHSFLVRFNFCFCLLEEVDLWNYPVPFWHFGMHDLLRTRGPSPPTSPT